MRSAFRSFSNSCLPAVLIGLILCQCNLWNRDTRSSDPSLPALMVERLGWMDEVAAIKQARSLPVTDPVREAALLDEMEKLAASSGLPGKPVRQFFAGQIKAAKVFQEEWLTKQSLQHSNGKALPDLAKTIRPALDDIGKRMITALAGQLHRTDTLELTVEARRRLHEAGYSEAVARPALEGLDAALRGISR